ncbi:hypothetical protein WBJ53_33165 (plasmid) [Spirosoma sp. SC4-14]|uniref:hypothetical protein n=1 Tax=Spirosoma sp. SC4-14 TaxID=3128900 RepID=UPI0030D12D8A
MERLIRRVPHVNKLLVVSLLAGLGVAIRYTYGLFKPGQKASIPLRQRSDYLTEWLGI